MFETTGDILNIAIAVSVAFVAFFLSFLIFYLIMVMRDVNFVTKKAKIISEKIDTYITSPARAVMALTEKLKLLTHFLEHHNKKKKEGNSDK
jgi:hypothetical protein